MAGQKTWTDLLGPITDADFVLGREIIRNTGEDHYKILWTLDDETIAYRCFDVWRSGH